MLGRTAAPFGCNVLRIVFLREQRRPQENPTQKWRGQFMRLKIRASAQQALRGESFRHPDAEQVIGQDRDRALRIHLGRKLQDAEEL